MKIFGAFAKDESGATAIEYGLIAALMAVVVIGAVVILEPALNGVFQNISTSLSDPASNLGGGGGGSEGG